MKFFYPQVQLARETVLDEPDTYYLHVVTFCPRTCFRANGHELDTSELDKGKYKVRIKLRQDPTLPDFDYITPVVHTLALGGIAFPGGEGEIEVSVVGDVLASPASVSRSVDPPPTTTQTGGTTTVGTTGSDGKTKPIDSDSLFSNF
ncbi:MAG: hypothetical protein JNN28_14985 [Saprospiraceae bacterium]|nr:hypothetical protein [Saprospiraceae bacterium]